MLLKSLAYDGFSSLFTIVQNIIFAHYGPNFTIGLNHDWVSDSLNPVYDKTRHKLS